MPNSTAAERLFHALGDPTRMAVIQRLCRGPESVSRLAAPHNMALPSFMQHLEVLEASGWISTRKEGRVRMCEVNPSALTQASSWLGEQRSLWERRLDQFDAVLRELDEQERDASTKE